METEFTPFASFGGGALIGLAAVLLMGSLGRVMGATGILAGLLSPESGDAFRWRAALLAGMVSGPLLMLAVTGQFPQMSVPVSVPMMLVGGFLVGVGVTYGAGCTSGHGVCGLSRLSPRSGVAVLTFMVATGVTVFFIRHVFGG